MSFPKSKYTSSTYLFYFFLLKHPFVREMRTRAHDNTIGRGTGLWLITTCLSKTTQNMCRTYAWLQDSALPNPLLSTSTRSQIPSPMKMLFHKKQSQTFKEAAKVSLSISNILMISQPLGVRVFHVINNSFTEPFDKMASAFNSHKTIDSDFTTPSSNKGGQWQNHG